MKPVGDAGQDRLGRPEPAAVVASPGRSGCPRTVRGVEVEQAGRCVEVGRDGDAEQPGLALGSGLGRSTPISVTSLLGRPQHPPGVALGDDGGAVGQEVEAPRRLEAGGDGVDDLAASGSPARSRLVARRGRVRGWRSSAGLVGVPVRSDRPPSSDEQAARVRASASGSAASLMPATVASPRSVGQPTRSRNSSSSACTSLGLLHREEVAARQLDVRRAVDAGGRAGHVAGAGQHVVAAGDERGRHRDLAQRDPRRAGRCAARGGSTSRPGW